MKKEARNSTANSTALTILQIKILPILLPIIFSLILLSALLPTTSAYNKEGTIKILAVNEDPINSKGLIAELQLEIHEGTGRVFLDTYPLTKVATQISLRFAKQIACSEYDIQCDSYDFFYTIKATPSMVGGPSAGAAASVLTVAMLKELKIDESSAITGTINSGGIIGLVGGVTEKSQAAEQTGIKKILLPVGTNINETQIKKLKIIEVATLKQAVAIMTNTKEPENNANILPNEEYEKIMSEIGKRLCERSDQLLTQIKMNNATTITKETTEKTPRFEAGENLTKIGKRLLEEKEGYSAASYCFRANVNLNAIYSGTKNATTGMLADKIATLKNEIKELEQKTNNKPLKTLADIQAYISVKERIEEAKNSLTEITASTNNAEGMIKASYVEERIESAKAWMSFFGADGKSLTVNNERLKATCLSKIAEAEERLAYSETIVPLSLTTETRKDLTEAYKNRNQQDDAQCLFNAIKAKSESDLIIGAFGGDENSTKKLLEAKTEVAKQAIVNAQKRGFFPIIAYSYYEYATTLSKEEEQGFGFLFLEYSLELASIDNYFSKEAILASNEKIKTPKETATFAKGMIAGALLIGIILVGRYAREYKMKNPNRPRGSEYHR